MCVNYDRPRVRQEDLDIMKGQIEKLQKIQHVNLNTDTVIGNLDKVLSEFLHLTELPGLDEIDAQTLKHHADDLIGVGRKALDTLKVRMNHGK